MMLLEAYEIQERRAVHLNDQLELLQHLYLYRFVYTILAGRDRFSDNASNN